MAGASLVLSFAPFGYWPLSMLSLMVFYRLIYQQPVRVQIYLHYAFALGLFGFGITWIYVSIHTYGGADKSLALGYDRAVCALLVTDLCPSGVVAGAYSKISDLASITLVCHDFRSRGVVARLVSNRVSLAVCGVCS
jgi:apolipoprotein N-acyltransferase